MQLAIKKPHLLFAHSVTGCDTVSALFGVGKKKAIDILDQYTDDDSLDVFTNETSSKEQIASVGEKFILKLYGAPKSVDKLDKQRYLSYNKSIRRSSLTTAFKLESLHPNVTRRILPFTANVSTSAAVDRQHARCYEMGLVSARWHSEAGGDDQPAAPIHCSKWLRVAVM